MKLFEQRVEKVLQYISQRAVSIKEIGIQPIYQPRQRQSCASCRGTNLEEHALFGKGQLFEERFHYDCAEQVRQCLLHLDNKNHEKFLEPKEGENFKEYFTRFKREIENGNIKVAA